MICYWRGAALGSFTIEQSHLIQQLAFNAQACFESHPVIVLGSGASIPHGLSGMWQLAEYLIEHVDADQGQEQAAWDTIRRALQDDVGLEEALATTSSPGTLVRKIVRLTWKLIAQDDLALMMNAASGQEKFGLTELLRGMSLSTHSRADIVTTNYDRVAEFAVDLAGYCHLTGFTPGFIRKREGHREVSFRRGSHAARTVRIWKVHGSVDWFQSPNHAAISIPVPSTLPEALEPLIVTPGVSKYERTHDEPFRSVIQGADAALSDAAAFLCIGYGFRDRHIQPKIAERCQEANVPIVVLARTLTSEAKEFLRGDSRMKYLALEMDGGGTRLFSNEHPAGTRIDKPNLWSIEGFNTLVL